MKEREREKENWSDSFNIEGSSRISAKMQIRPRASLLCLHHIVPPVPLPVAQQLLELHGAFQHLRQPKQPHGKQQVRGHLTCRSRWQYGGNLENCNKTSTNQKTHNATWAKARLAVFECIYNRYIKNIYIYMSKFNKLRLYSEVGSEQERQHWSDLSGAKQRLWPKSFPSGRLCMLHLEQCLADRRLQPQYDSCWNCWPTMLDKISDLRFEGEQKLYYMDYISF